MTRLALALIAGVTLLLGTITAQNRPESQQVASSALSVDRGDFSRVDSYLRMPVVLTKPSPTAVVQTFRVSFYCDGDRTAIGVPTSRGVAAAAYSRDTYEPVIPFGSKIELEGIGLVTILDTCPACESNWLDVFVPDRTEAIQGGVKWVSGTVKDAK